MGKGKRMKKEKKKTRKVLLPFFDKLSCVQRKEEGTQQPIQR